MSLTLCSLSHQIHDGASARTLFNNLTFTVQAGQCIALMGDSGSGKTTLLNLIAGLEPIQSGDILVDQESLARASEKALSAMRKSHIGIIFQQFNLLSSLTVRDNIEFSAKLSGRYDQAHGLSLAQSLGITSLLDKYPGTLSGGEMQRVAIARALNNRPKLLLADEPTGNLDENNSSHVVEQLVQLAKLNNAALLMVTHSASVARKMDQVYRLSGGDITLVDV